MPILPMEAFLAFDDGLIDEVDLSEDERIRFVLLVEWIWVGAFVTDFFMVVDGARVGFSEFFKADTLMVKKRI